MRWQFWKPESKGVTVGIVQRAPFYHMTRTREFHAGAMSYAFTPQRLLPPQNLYGHGITFPSRRVLPLPPLVARPATIQAGLGGIVAGQLVLQPLVDPTTGGA